MQPLTLFKTIQLLWIWNSSAFMMFHWPTVSRKKVYEFEIVSLKGYQSSGLWVSGFDGLENPLKSDEKPHETDHVGLVCFH